MTAPLMTCTGTLIKLHLLFSRQLIVKLLCIFYLALLHQSFWGLFQRSPVTTCLARAMLRVVGLSQSASKRILSACHTSFDEVGQTRCSQFLRHLAEFGVRDVILLLTGRCMLCWRCRYFTCQIYLRPSKINIRETVSLLAPF
jgi:hypothetical protein